MNYDDFKRRLNLAQHGYNMTKSPDPTDRYKNGLIRMTIEKRKNLIKEDEKLLDMIQKKYGKDPKVADLVHELQDEIILCRRINAHKERKGAATCQTNLYIDGYDPFCRHAGYIEVFHVIHGARLG